MWRVLARLRPESFARIKVRVVDGAQPCVKFLSKCTTVCEGEWIEVKLVQSADGGITVSESPGESSIGAGPRRIVVGQPRDGSSSVVGGAQHSGGADVSGAGVQWSGISDLFVSSKEQKQ